ncbi:MAG: enoyl-CoA hydratase [Vicinamibacterales bacterium]
MPPSNVSWAITEPLGILTFTRPAARNALTWDMYEALERACDAADDDPRIRALIIRGSGGAFAAGTDIAQFAGFSSGADGLAYERRLDALADRLERVRVPTIAEVDGAAVGGGCLIAAVCDLRICSPRARFGVPVARTLGNCLSMANLARLVDLIGPARTRDLLLTARLVDATEALSIGLATRIVEQEALSAEVETLARELATRASSTITATKTLLRRLREARTPPPGAADDVIAACYGSEEFREGVAAFTEGRVPRFS